MQTGLKDLPVGDHNSSTRAIVMLAYAMFIYDAAFHHSHDFPQSLFKKRFEILGCASYIAENIFSFGNILHAFIYIPARAAMN